MLALFLLQLSNLDLIQAISYCTGSSCSCPLGKNMLDTTCVPLCPTGYFLSGSNCFQIENSTLNLFQLEFYRYWDFTNQKIGNFSLSTQDSIVNNTSTLPVFTKDRGFYFKNKTQITSQVSWLLAPSFTMRLALKAMKDGTVFKVYDSNGVFVDLYVKEGSVCLFLMLTQIQMVNTVAGKGKGGKDGGGDDGGGGTGGTTTPVYVNSVEENCTDISYDKWTILTVSVTQSITYLEMKFIRKTELLNETRFLYEGKDFLAQKQGLKYAVGSIVEGFSGFIYEMILDNRVIADYIKVYEFVDCDFGFYYDYLENKCSFCSESLKNLSMSFNLSSNLTLSEHLTQNFTDLALCTREENYCYSDECFNCSGFTFETCTLCKEDPLNPTDNSTSSTQQNSSICDFDFFNSTDCPSNQFLVENKSVCVYNLTFDSKYITNCSSTLDLTDNDTVCVYNSSFYNKTSTPDPAFNLKFDSFDNLYGDFFKSGENLSDFDQRSRSDEDPYPIKNRGIYFSGNSYLKSIYEISLNIEFTLSFFYKAFGNQSIDSNLWLSENLEIKPSGLVRFCFTDGISKYCEFSYSDSIYTNWWRFISISISYNETNRITSVSRTIYQYTENAISIQSHIFLNKPSIAWIGKGEVNFNGFIYEISYWNEVVPQGLYYKSFCIGC